MRKICKTLNHTIKCSILFAYARSGCDTTSHSFGYGKNSMVKILQKNKEGCNIADVLIFEMTLILLGKKIQW